jgi:hypothetical protein
MERRSRQLTGIPVTALAGLLAIGPLMACTSGSGGVNPQTPAASTAVGTKSASPSTTAPTLPDAARQPTRAGAEAFFRYFIDVYNFTFTSQDVAPLRMIMTSECQFCTSTIAAVQSAREGARHTDGGQVTASMVTAAPGEPAEGIVINAIVNQASSKLVDGAGKVVETAAATTQVRMDASAVWIGDAWQMRAARVSSKAQQ